ncbi:MAG TPA: hypothetical protein PK906_15620 [Spirochaetota bacterium]|nr:hypothetical protein [Spirochaetota bacterium]
MAKVTFRFPVKSVHGRVGNVIYYSVNGHNYARSYSIPENPRTEAQQANRASFAEAVKEWQALPETVKTFYNRMAAGKPLSGYNIFISMKMKNISPLLLSSQMGEECRIPSSYTQAINSVFPSAGTFTSSRYIIIESEHPVTPLKKPPGLLTLAA